MLGGVQILKSSGTVVSRTVRVTEDGKFRGVEYHIISDATEFVDFIHDVSFAVRQLSRKDN